MTMRGRITPYGVYYEGEARFNELIDVIGLIWRSDDGIVRIRGNDIFSELTKVNTLTTVMATIKLYLGEKVEYRYNQKINILEIKVKNNDEQHQSE